jgi:hypothetical protein
MKTVIRKPFTIEEDFLIKHFYEAENITKWKQIAAHLPGRTAKSCKDRYMNYMIPNLTTDQFSQEEDQLLLELIQNHCKKWNIIALRFPRRSPNTIKNHWYRKLIRTVDSSFVSSLRNETGGHASPKRPFEPIFSENSANMTGFDEDLFGDIF